MDHRLCLALALTLLGCTAQEPRPRANPPQVALQPAPTEHILDPEAEERQSSARKRWFEELHRAPPEIDWRAVERENGRAQIAKRNALALREDSGVNLWVERGSENVTGRMHAAAPSSDGQTLFAGTSLGGVWMGPLDGTSWTPIGDNLYGGAHSLAVVPGLAPGDPDAVLAATDGGLIHVTRDLGATWVVPSGLPSNAAGVRRVVVKTDGTWTVFVLLKTTLGTWSLYRSTDRLLSFTKVDGPSAYDGDVWVPRDGGSAVYVLRSDNLYKSSDNGTSWSLVGGLGSGSNDGELAGSEAGAPRFYAMVNVSGVEKLYRSDDAGASWAYLLDATDYWNTLNASSIDANVCAWGGVEVHRSIDGGATFAVVNTWGEYYGDPANKLHADTMGIDLVSNGSSETWYVASDGGLYRSEDQLASVENLTLTGMRVSQYYSTLTSAADPNHIAAGSQDQGYQRSSVAPPGGTTSFDFTQLISGDYGHLTSGDGTHAWVFSVYPGFVLVHKNESTPALYTTGFPATESYAWLPPIVADTRAPSDFFFCATRLWRYAKSASANTWTPSLWSTMNFAASAGEYLSALEFSPLDDTRAYAATNYGRLFFSNDRGVSWTQSAGLGPAAHYFYGTALLASAIDRERAFVGGSGYLGAPVWRTTDGGATWQAFGTGLPNTLVYCLGERHDGSMLYAGTDTSAYATSTSTAQWADITSNESPLTLYWSVETLPNANTLRFGTYGRGIWDYETDAPPSASDLGCGVNPAQSLSVLSGVPSLGTTLSIGIDNPLGTQLLSLSLLFVSLAPDPNYPCGTLLPGFGMSGPGASGELLVSFAPPDPALLIAGGFWSTPGVPVVIPLAVPSDTGLLGLHAFVQGLLLHPQATFGVKYALTDGVELTIGP